LVLLEAGQASILTPQQDSGVGAGDFQPCLFRAANTGFHELKVRVLLPPVLVGNPTEVEQEPIL
jgi:hypothetical protein